MVRAWPRAALERRRSSGLSTGPSPQFERFHARSWCTSSVSARTRSASAVPGSGTGDGAVTLLAASTTARVSSRARRQGEGAGRILIAYFAFL